MYLLRLDPQHGLPVHYMRPHLCNTMATDAAGIRRTVRHPVPCIAGWCWRPSSVERADQGARHCTLCTHNKTPSQDICQLVVTCLSHLGDVHNPLKHLYATLLDLTAEVRCLSSPSPCHQPPPQTNVMVLLLDLPNSEKLLVSLFTSLLDAFRCVRATQRMAAITHTHNHQ